MAFHSFNFKILGLAARNYGFYAYFWALIHGTYATILWVEISGVHLLDYNSMEYNTQRKQILLKEYGRNIQVMVENLMQVADKESRNKQAAQLVDLMKQFVQPGVKENADLSHKLWDDLFIISDYQLEVDSPYPKPDAAVVNSKPEPIKYSFTQPKLKHYGKNIEYLVQKVLEIADEKQKEDATIYVARLMKMFFNQYNKEVVEDEVIKEQLLRISNGKIVLNLDRVKAENLLDLSNERRSEPNGGGSGQNNHRFKGKNNKNNRRNRNKSNKNKNN